MTRRLAIALITYGSSPARTDYALRTIDGLAEHLRLQDGDIRWYVADDGSPEEHYRSVLTRLEGWSQVLLGTHHERMGAGVSQNHAALQCFDWAPVTLWMEDDWELIRHLDVTRYYDLVDHGFDDGKENLVGMVRMGYLGRNQRTSITSFAGDHYLLFNKSGMYGFSGHPALRHRRWWEAYGPYPGDKSAQECELALDWSYRSKEGPGIVWPVDGQSGWGYFGHIGTEKAG